MFLANIKGQTHPVKKTLECCHCQSGRLQDVCSSIQSSVKGIAVMTERFPDSLAIAIGSDWL